MQALAELKRRQHGVFSRDQARAIGLTDDALYRRVSSGGLVRMLPRVFRDPAAPESWLQKLTAGLLWAGDEAVASHRSAAALWEFDGCLPGPFEITSPKGLRPPNGFVVHRHDLPLSDTARVASLRVTSPTRTLIDLASCVSDEELEIALDSGIRKGLTSLPYLTRRFDGMKAKGRPGSALMASLLAARSGVEGHVDSPLETRFLRLIRQERLPLPKPGVEVGRYRLDFAYPSIRLAIELEGYAFHSGRKAWSHDLHRRNELVSLGWNVLHFTWDDVVHQPGVVVAELRKHLCPNFLQ